MTTTYTVPTLSDGNLRLRAPRKDDVAARFAIGNDIDIEHMFGVDRGAFQPLTQKASEAWVKFHLEHSHSWFIDIDSQLSGVIFLHSFNQSDRRAVVAMGLLRPAQLGQGYGSRTMHLVLGEAFGALSLHRVSLRVIDYNARAIAAYKKVGFVEEGRERQSARVGENWHDDLIMGILAPDYRAAQQVAQ